MHHPYSSSYLLFSILWNMFITISGGESSSWAQELPKPHNPCPDNVTKLHFYFHDTISDKKNATAVHIAGPEKVYEFGSFYIIDNPLTIDPRISSHQIGRAQGMYVYVSQSKNEDLALVSMYTLVFTDGEYNGSSLSMFGLNLVRKNPRELPILGGTGRFRLTRGYNMMTNYMAGGNGDAIVQYNITLFTPTC